MKNRLIIDLGIHPFADTFIKKKQLHKSEPIFPLKCFLNKSTGIVGNLIKTNQNERYNLYDYSYTSSNSEYSRNYWKSFSKKIIDSYKVDSRTKIIEIGSNDGFLLKQLKKVTEHVYGVDASSAMCKLSNKNKIKTLNCIFNKSNSLKIKKKLGKFDIVIANNVLNHANDPNNFIAGIKNLLSKKGIVVFEVPYWYDLVKEKKFDQIYHEHVSYLTAKSSLYLMNKNNFEIFNIHKSPYHGGSIRVHSRIKDKNKKKIKLNKKLVRMINKEEKFKLYNFNTYKDFMKIINIKKIKFLKSIFKYKLKGYKIIGVGAAAKANTFLNFIGLNSQVVDYVTDISKHKIGKYTPLSRIPIFHDNEIKKIKQKTCVICLAWNINKLLRNKLKILNKNLVFLKF